MANQTINLEGTEYISNIPSVYYGATAGLVSRIDPFAGSLMGKVTLPGGTVITMSIKLIQDPDNPRKVIASTTLASGITYALASSVASSAILEAAIGATLASLGVVVTPVTVGIALVGGVAVVATIGGNYLYDGIYKALEFAENYTETQFVSPQITGTITQEEFILQSLENNPTFCMDAFPKYKNYRQRVEIHNKGENLADFIRYDSQSKEATIQTSDDYEDDYVTRLFKAAPEIKQLTLNAQTYNVVDEDNKLLIRNAIEDIPKVSFLLSHILIKVGEVLDIGDQGVYTIKRGDTMSQIAEAYGMSTKELLKLNTWLIDEGKVHFDQGVNIFTCKDFKANKSLHVRTKNKQKGEKRGTKQKVA